MTDEPALLARLAALDACAVSDALDALRLPGATTGIVPAYPGARKIAGRAVTVRVVPRTDAAPAAHLGAPAIAASGPGDVLVVANGGRVDVSSWGGILSLAARERGIEGVVVDGACRDVAEAEELGFPVYARAAVMVTARGRIVQDEWKVPVTFGATLVRPGDLVLADRNGVAVVPQARAEDVIAEAEAITAREADMAARVRAGQSVVDVMHDSRFTARSSAHHSGGQGA